MCGPARSGNSYTSEIVSGIIRRISARKSSGIASCSVSISNLFSKNRFMSCVLGLMGTITAVVKRFLISTSTWGLPVTNIRVLGDP